MKNIRNKAPRPATKAVAFASAAAVAATLGLAACGSTAPTSSDDGSTTTTDRPATTDAPASNGSTVSKYNLTQAWVGTDDDTMTYYFQGAKKETGAALVFHTGSNTYERWAGKMETPASNQVSIVDENTGKTFGFTIEEIDADGTIAIKMDDGTEARLSPMSIEEVGNVLDEVSTYASEAGKTD